MYQLRGQRVTAIPDETIQSTAIAVCSILEFKHKRARKKRYDQTLEQLSIFGITINPVADEEWNEATYGSISGHYDPQTVTISIPESIYFDACAGDRTALFVVMHEIGHLVLGHQPALHFSKTPPTQAEDAEWQADAFAEHALTFLGYGTKQMAFEFY